MDTFKPVCWPQCGLGQTLPAVTLNLDMLRAECPCLILLRKTLTPKACAGCLGFFFKKSNLLNILNILRYILSVSSNYCHPSHIFRAFPPLFPLFRQYSSGIWYMNINYGMLEVQVSQERILGQWNRAEETLITNNWRDTVHWLWKPSAGFSLLQQSEDLGICIFDSWPLLWFK